MGCMRDSALDPYWIREILTGGSSFTQYRIHIAWIRHLAPSTRLLYAVPFVGGHGHGVPLKRMVQESVDEKCMIVCSIRSETSCASSFYSPWYTTCPSVSSSAERHHRLAATVQSLSQGICNVHSKRSFSTTKSSRRNLLARFVSFSPGTQPSPTTTLFVVLRPESARLHCLIRSSSHGRLSQTLFSK